MRGVRATWIRMAAYLFAFATIAMASSFQATAGGKDAKVPFRVPFDLAKEGGEINTTFSVSQQQTYDIALRYGLKRDDAADRDRMWELAGGSRKVEQGKWITPGAPVKVSIRVLRPALSGDEVVVEKEVESPKLSSWGGESLNATIVKVQLLPGTYRLVVKNQMEARQFAGTDVSISVSRAYLGK